MTPSFTTHAGVEVPQLIYGTAWKKAQTGALVAQALAAGFRGVDTACHPKHYNEPGVGEGLRGLDLDGIFLQTKFTPLSAHDPEQIPYDPEAPIPERVRQSFEASLRNLGVERLDSLLLHAPMPTPQQTLAAWRAMEGLVEEGRVRMLGLSNCYHLDYFEWLYEQAEHKPAALQNRFYPTSGYDVPLRALCRERGIAYQSFWTLTANPQLLAATPITEAARRHDEAPAQILFRWLTQRGACPLTGTTSPEHMAQNLGIFDFELSEEEIGAIGRLIGEAG